MAREVINIIERTNIIFIFMEITLDSSMLSHYVRRVLVFRSKLAVWCLLKKRLGKKRCSCWSYLLTGGLYKHDQVSMFIFLSNCYGWTRWLDWQTDSIVGLQNIKKKNRI